jgi:hypothetical protein
MAAIVFPPTHTRSNTRLRTCFRSIGLASRMRRSRPLITSSARLRSTAAGRAGSAAGVPGPHITPHSRHPKSDPGHRVCLIARTGLPGDFIAHGRHQAGHWRRRASDRFDALFVACHAARYAACFAGADVRCVAGCVAIRRAIVARTWASTSNWASRLPWVGGLDRITVWRSGDWSIG